jgi:hypothetical protein
LGKTRAKQFSLIKEADPECKLGDKVMCVQLHGDASFTGQGVVMESLGLSGFSYHINSAHFLTLCRQSTSFHERWKCASCRKVNLIYWFSELASLMRLFFKQ